MKKKDAYQDALEKLENIVREMEEGEMNIDEMIEKVNLATQLLQHCKETLHTIEQQLPTDD